MDEAKLKIVDLSQVPSGRVEKGKWEIIFEKIPLGKAMIIPEEEASASAVRSSLYELQAKGRFKNLLARRVKDKDGKYKIYVINNNAYRATK